MSPLSQVDPPPPPPPPPTPNNLLLIDIDSVKDYQTILTTLTTDTSYVLFSYSLDTSASLQSKITGTYSTVGILQNTPKGDSYGLTKSMYHGRVASVSQQDASLNTWSQHYDLVQWLVQNRGLTTLDWLISGLWSDSDWVYIINSMKTNWGINVRASISLVGTGGNYVLESDNVNTIGLYFTSSVKNYPGSFLEPLYYLGNQNQNNDIVYDNSGGVVYQSFFATSSDLETSASSGVLGLPGDISGVITMTKTYFTNSYLAVKTDKSGLVWGSRLAGAYEQNTVYDASLVNIKRVFSGNNGCFAVLRDDNSVYCLGNAPYNGEGSVEASSVAIASPYVETTLTKAAPNPLNDVSGVYNINDAFCALKTDGSVVAWGMRSNGGDCSGCQSLLVGITKVIAISGYGGGFVALRDDNQFVVWKGDSNVSWSGSRNTSLYSTSIGNSYVDGKIQDICVGSCGAGGSGKIVFLRTDNILCEASVAFSSDGSGASTFSITNKIQTPAVSLAGMPYLTQTTPDAPTLQSVVVGNQTAQIYFQDGNYVGQGVIGYKYSLNDGDYVWASQTTSPLSLAGLVNGTSYTITVKTANSNGSSVASNSLSFTPGDIPSTPTITKVVPGNESVSVYVIPSNLYGSALVSYYYQLNGAGSYSATTLSGGIINISGLTNGTAYTVKMKSENGLGLSSASAASDSFVPYGLPTAPTITSVVAGDKSVSVYFDAGDGNGGTISRYCFRTTSDGISTDYLYTENTSSPIVISGLNNGTSYTVQLKAFTEFGLSTASTASSSVIPYGTPVPPTITRVSIVDGSANVYFNEGDSNGRSVTDYTYSLNGGAFVSSGQTSSPILLTDLTLGTSYTVELKAVTSVGTSASSNTSNSFVPFTTPLPPTVSSVTATDQGLSVAFTDPDLKGCSFVGFQYDLNDDEDYKWTKTTTSPIVIGGLVNGTSYLVRLKTICVEGVSAKSSNSTSVSPYKIQLPPSIVSAEAGDRSIVISFSNPQTYNSAISGYTYSLNGGSYANVSSSNLDVSASTILVDGLTNGTDYTVTIKSVSNVGTSDESNTTSVLTPFKELDPPNITSVEPDNGMVLVYFTDGSLNGGTAILGYKYTLDGTNYVWAKETASPLMVKNLTNGTSYQIRIVSVNATNTSSSSNLSSSFVPFTLPSPPSITGITTGNQTASISVVDGSANGRTIIGYSYSLDDNTYVDVSKNSPIVITGLTNGTSYNVYLKSISSAGTSTNYTTSDAFVPYGIQGAPVISSISPAYQSAVLVMSNPVLNGLDDNGISITGYEYSVDGGSYTLVDTSTNTFTISGLVNGLSYQFYVKSVSSAGTSVASSISSVVVPKNVPEAPTITSVVPGSGKVLLYFTDGSNNGSPITGYKYTLDGSTYYTALQTTSPLTLFNLENATSYNIRIKATNVMGDSENSNYSGVVTPFDVPFPPVVNDIIPGDQCAIVYMDEVNSNGSPVIKYQYTLGSSLIDISGLTLPLTIPGFKNKTAYSIRVVAINAAGTSNVSNLKTVIVGTPLAPVINSTTPIARGMIIHFTAPESNNYPITQYNYTFGDGKFLKAVGTTSPVTIFGLVNGTSYNIQLNAQNVNGVSVASNAIGNRIPFDIPSKVTISSVVPYYGRAVVSIIQPANNGSAITKYGYALDANTVFTDVSGVGSVLNIYDLPNNVNYTLKMVAYNAAGPSLVSGPSKSVKFVYLPPSQVKITALTASFEQITVAFVAPLANGTPITKYKYALNTDTEYTDASGLSLPLVIRGLQNNISYNVRIIATNEAGDSIPSLPAAKAVSYVYLPPLAPVVSTVTTGNQSATFTFVAPATRNAAITGYKYSLDAGTTKLDVSGLTSPATISGFSNDVSYTLLVYADSAAGLSNASAPKIFRAVYKEPDRPTITTVLPSNQSATVSFNAGAFNGAPITNYLYSVDGGVTQISAGKSTSPIDVSGLTNDVSYNIVLYAVNEVGNSPPSLPKLFTPLLKVPDKPTIGTIVTGNQSAAVAFTPGAVNGAPITNYLYSLDGGTTTVSAETNISPINISGLTNNTSYNIVLYAVNQVGNSLPSLSKAFITVYTEPAPPVLGTVSTTITGATVPFVAGKENGSPITNYLFSINGGSLISAGVNKTPVIITGLTTKTSYTVYIIAVNAVGQSLPSTTKTFITR